MRAGKTIESPRKQKAFTLIELLVVFAIIALLLSIAVPRYFQSIEHSKDTILQENLRITRQTIDKFYEDTGHYPDSLQELVDKKYLRALPVDPILDNNSSWVLVAPDDPEKGKVYNIQSAAPGISHDGKAYADF